MGFMMFFSSMDSKEFHIGAPSPYPCHNVHSYGSWAAATSISDVTFHNFKNKTKCGARQSIFELNPYASDYVPVQNFDSITFDNVEENAMTYIYDPKPRWNNMDDCPHMSCTAPSNIILDFVNTKFLGDDKPDLRERDF